MTNMLTLSQKQRIIAKMSELSSKLREKGQRLTALLLASLWIFLPLSAQTGTQGHIMGFIYDSDGKTPVPNARVILKDMENDNEFPSNVTNEFGDYHIKDVPTGNYKVIIEVNNKVFRIKRADFLVRIDPDKTNYISFSLKKDRLPLAIIIPGAIVAGAGTGILIGELIKDKEESPTTK